jgi:V/A-type H+-transporting ATPase subunit I
MIVRMKRLTLLCLTRDRDAALDELRALGLVHVADSRPPAGEELDALRTRLAAAERALAALPEGRTAPAAGEASPAGAAGVVAEVLALLDRRDELSARAGELSRELARYARFGDFDLEEILGLARAGVWTALAVTRSDARLSAPDGTMVTVLGHERREQFLLLTALGRRPEPLPELGCPYDLVAWPERPLDDLRAELAAATAESDAADRRLEELSTARDDVAALVRTTAEETRYEEVRAGMDEAGEVSVLAGYVPAADQDAVRAAAVAHGWGILLDDPQPGEQVPVQLDQARWVKPIRTLFDLLRIYPGYWEADPGWVILPFFSLFFAMIVGDAGYAVLLLALTAVLQWRFKKVPAHVYHMMYIAGFATLLWGVLSGSYFGVPTLPPFAQQLQLDWLSDRDNLIDLCFLIGALHLSFAHVWNAASYGRAHAWTKLVAQGGWLLVVWSMFFIARSAVLGRGAPGFLLLMLLGGVLLVAAFMKTPAELKTGWIDHAMLPLTLVGNFVDILSYIRLFAVGYASIAVLAAFNGMAADIGFHSPLTAVAASLLLLFANALNIVLVGLGVLVHAVRLNTLEFSTHKGLAWQGHTLYTPFAGPRSQT